MSKKMLIDAGHREETRVALISNRKVEDFDFESESKKPLRGNIYLARVTRVEPSLQAAFVEYGGNRHGFLAFSEIHSDYYQIPVSDRDKLREAEELEAQLFEEMSRVEDEQDAPAEETDDTEEASSDDVEAEADDELTAETEEDEDTSSDDDDDSDEESVEDVAEDDAEELEASGADDEDEEDAEAARERAALLADAEEAVTEDIDDEEDDGKEPKELSLEERYQRARRERIRILRNYRIQEVIKRRQILLIQVVKEERGNKGAALTTYLSLAGRYCVLMPNTSRGGGISRKISNGSDRRRLRKAMNELDIPTGIGLIIRTAGAKRTKAEIKRDYEYLLRLWQTIRDLTMKSIAPCLIYEEASLIKRAIRDLYDKDTDLVLVEGEAGYREAKDFMKMLMPSHAKNVQPYKEKVPLFFKERVEEQLDEMYQPVVKLKSGGYLVIQQTEALVSIDVNSGRATKERNIEATALKTNQEAAVEVARQCKLRDLAGLIVVDFIDMEENRNNRSVERKLKDAMKTDRARIQIGRISSFGLLEMSRQRRRSGIVDGTTSLCPTCHGAGNVRSNEMAALRILRSIEQEAIQGRAGVIAASTSTEVALFILNQKRDWLNRIEETYGLSVEINADREKVGDTFEISKRGAPKESARQQAVVTADLADMSDVDTSEADTRDADDEQEERPTRKRRRRRRRKNDNDDVETSEQAASDSSGDDSAEASDDSEDGEKPKRRRRRGRRGGRRNRRSEETSTDAENAEEQASSDDTSADAEKDDSAEEEKPARKKRASKRKAKAKDSEQNEAAANDDDAAEEKPKRKRTRKKKADSADDKESKAEDKPAKAADKEPKPEKEAAKEPAPAKTPPPDTESSGPKRGGWWQRALGKS
jgi:ribonuclease E